MKKLVLSTLAAVASMPLLAEGMEGGISAASASMWAAGLCMATAALGGAIGQSKVGASAMEGIARNPKAKGDMFVPMILSLVFIETLVLFAFALSFLMQGKY